MGYIVCILIAVFLSMLCTQWLIHKHNEFLIEQIKTMSGLTFDTSIELLKKVGINEEVQTKVYTIEVVGQSPYDFDIEIADDQLDGVLKILNALNTNEYTGFNDSFSVKEKDTGRELLNWRD